MKKKQLGHYRFGLIERVVLEANFPNVCTKCKYELQYYAKV